MFSTTVCLAGVSIGVECLFYTIVSFLKDHIVNEKAFPNYNNSGTYGTLEQKVSHRIDYLSAENGSGKGTAKMKYIFRRLFPPKTEFLLGHPFYRTHKWLLPFGYIKRLFTRIPKSFRRTVSELKYIRKK